MVKPAIRSTDLIWSRVLAATVLFICMSLTACHSASTTDSDTRVKQILKNAQERQGFVIGQNYHGHLEYFDSLRDFNSQTAPTPVSAELLTLRIPTENRSETSLHDGNWHLKCHKGKCLVKSNQRHDVSFSIEQNRLLTPIYWSPDQSLGFYLQKGPTWRSPARCSMEDERDIVVIEASSGTQGVVKTVCGGFPYDQLRWFVASGK